MVPTVAVAVALWMQTPSDAEIQRANGQILAFGIEALQNQGGNLTAELAKPETYWAGSQPLQHWTPESRRLAFETFADASEKKPDVRRWLLDPETTTGLNLAYRLIIMVD